MTSDLPPGPQAGFTLIEVLVAMLILAVGLLGLEALGIGAARSIVRADQNSEYAMLASRTMEGRILDIRRNGSLVSTGESCATDAPTQLYVCSQVSTQTQLGTLPAKTARITVTVRRTPSGPVQFNLVSHVFDSNLPPV